MKKLYVCAEPECRNYFVADDNRSYTCVICGAPMLKTKIPVDQFEALSDKQQQNFIKMLVENIDKYVEHPYPKETLENSQTPISNKTVNQLTTMRQKETENFIANFFYAFALLSLLLTILYALISGSTGGLSHYDFYLNVVLGILGTLFLFGFYKIIQLLQTIADRLYRDDEAKK